MADVTITAANVIATNTKRTTGTAGEALTAGKLVYLDPITKKYLLADNNGVAAARAADGFALNGAAANQPVVVHESGDITVGGTLTAGATYFLSDTPGGLCPDTDVGTGETVCQIGIAKSTTVLSVNIINPGVAR